MSQLSSDQNLKVLGGNPHNEIQSQMLDECYSMKNTNVEDRQINIFDDISNALPPSRLRKRILDTEMKKRSLDEIENRLREAMFRRQKFLQWLANKAKARMKNNRIVPLGNAEEKFLKIEAKLSAAELKREERAEEIRKKRARMDVIRKEVRANAVLLKERREQMCSCALESRVAQASANREAVFQAQFKRRASLHCWAERILANRERVARLHDERLGRRHAAILKKIDSANAKREARLAAESCRAGSVAAQAREVAERVWRDRQAKLQARLQRLELKIEHARRRRQEILQERISSRRFIHTRHRRECAELLSKKLIRCWRRFQRLHSTTFTLAKNFLNCGVSVQDLEKLSLEGRLSFDDMSSRITSSATLHATRLLLRRLERRLFISASHSVSSNSADFQQFHAKLSVLTDQVPAGSTHDDGCSISPSRSCYRIPSIDHLYSKLFQGKSVRDRRSTGTAKRPNSKFNRYSERVLLCAYMIKFHPKAIFNDDGIMEKDLSAAAVGLLKSFELLLSCIMKKRNTRNESKGSSSESDEGKNNGLEVDYRGGPCCESGIEKPFSTLLWEFDSDWVKYFHCFVAWKLPHSFKMVDELIKTACNLEMSKISVSISKSHSDDKKLVVNQVVRDQRDLADSICKLAGVTGLMKMEAALQDVRGKMLNASSSNAIPSSADHSVNDQIDAATLESESTTVSSKNGNEGGADEKAGGISEIEVSEMTKIRGSCSQDSECVGGSCGSEKGKEKANPQDKESEEVKVRVQTKENQSGKVSLKERVEREEGIASSDAEGSAGESNNEAHCDLSEKEMQNCILANAMLYDSTFNALIDEMHKRDSRVSSGGASAAAPAREDSDFWSLVELDLMKEPIDPCRVIDLIKGIYMDISNLKRDKAFDSGTEETFDPGYLKQIFVNESLDFEQLRKILDFFVHAIMALDSLDKERTIKAKYQSLLLEIQADVDSFVAFQRSSGGMIQTNVERKQLFAGSVTKALKFVSRHLLELKRDVGLFRMSFLTSIIRGDSGIGYIRNFFARKFSLCSFLDNLFSGSSAHAVVPETHEELSRKLPRTAFWLSQTRDEIAVRIKPVLGAATSELIERRAGGLSTKKEMDSLLGNRSSDCLGGVGNPGDGSSPIPAMKAGRRFFLSSSGSNVVTEKAHGDEGVKKGVAFRGAFGIAKIPDWFSPSAVVSMGFLNFLKTPHAVTESDLPEVFWLDVPRIASFQQKFQALIVCATCVLIATQILGVRSGDAKHAHDAIQGQTLKIMSLLEDSKVNMNMIVECMAEIIQNGINVARAEALPSSSSSSLSLAVEASTTAATAGDEKARTKEMVFHMLGKALSVNDVVFSRVMNSITTAMYIVSLFGNDGDTIRVAGEELKKIDGCHLMDVISDVCADLTAIVRVNLQVYSPWYSVLLNPAQGSRKH